MPFRYDKRILYINRILLYELRIVYVIRSKIPILHISYNTIRFMYNSRIFYTFYLRIFVYTLRILYVFVITPVHLTIHV